MTDKRPQSREEMLQQDVRELTGLLRRDAGFADLRDALAARGLAASEIILAGLIGGEDETRYGVILTTAGECILFDAAADNSFTQWEFIDKPEDLTSDFPAVSVGISMLRKGQIS